MNAMRWRLLAVWIACMTLALSALALTAGGIYAALDERHRAAALALLDGVAPLPFVLVLGIAVGAGFLSAWIVRGYFRPLAVAAEAIAILASANREHRIDAPGPRELQALVDAINALGARYREVANEMEARIAQSNQALENEKNRLAVLMAELAQGVVACDPQGTIMLYNEQARRLFAASPEAYIGLGRPLYGLLDRDAIENAMHRLDQRTDLGDLDPIEILTTPLHDGRIARVRISPIAGRNLAGTPTASGFVLLLEDVTDEVTGVERRNRILSELNAAVRTALATLRPSLERFAGGTQPGSGASSGIDTAIAVCNRLSEAADTADKAHAADDRTQMRTLDVVRATDLVAIVAAAARGQGYTVNAGNPLAELAIRLHVQDLLQTVRYLTARLRDEFRIRDLSIDLSADDGRLMLDLAWLGHRLTGATLAAWEDDPLAVGGEASPISLREILQRQGADISHEIDRISGRSRLRLALPGEAAAPAAHVPSRSARPIFYDFDLPALSCSSSELSARPLTSLAYTAFDTETTGLDPGGGDEIISIGAIRIVNARLLENESFDQLIDPQRPIHPEAVKVHGIRPEMLRGQPTLDRVLRRFHGFCAGTVLIGHNVAFDLRFLQVKEEALDVRFRQPVLDTLLLAAVLHEHTGDNRLEAIAHRLGIEVVARHTALGDARVTAAVFLKMLPLLAARGIRSLGEAQSASEQTSYAKLRY